MNYFHDKYLYLILDTSYVPLESLEQTTLECCLAGIDILQFRDKKLMDNERYTVCLSLLKITQQYEIPFIVNDRLDIALGCGANGVHLGQDDLPVDRARDIADKYGRRDFIIGKSTHSLEQVRNAQQENCDYLAIGPLFSTQTKPDYIPIGLEVVSDVVKNIHKPLFGIGGVTCDTIESIRKTGLKRVAVVSAILQSPDKAKTINEIKKRLKEEA